MIQNITSGGALRAFAIVLAILLLAAGLTSIVVGALGPPLTRYLVEVGARKIDQIDITPNGGPTAPQTPPPGR